MTRVLVLVPTEFELHKLQPLLADCVKQADGVMLTCGFGPVASGIRAAQLLARHNPQAAVLVGIAGAFGSQMRIGTAGCFSRIACYGVGAGSGSDFQTASELGWFHWSDSESGETIGDVIETGLESVAGAPSDGLMLLTACAASASPEDAAQRLQKFPQAVAEDMEAFSVAMACRMSGTPLTVIRGISNMAGDRDKARWNINAAIEAAAELTAAELTALRIRA